MLYCGPHSDDILEADANGPNSSVNTIRVDFGVNVDRKAANFSNGISAHAHIQLRHARARQIVNVINEPRPLKNLQPRYLDRQY